MSVNHATAAISPKIFFYILSLLTLKIFLNIVSNTNSIT